MDLLMTSLFRTTKSVNGMPSMNEVPSITGIEALDAELTHRFPDLRDKTEFDLVLLRELIVKYVADYTALADNIVRETNPTVVSYLNDVAEILRRLGLKDLGELQRHLKEQKARSREKLLKKYL